MSDVAVVLPEEEPEKSRRGRKPRGENSKEIAAVEKMQVDIETADRLYGDGLMYDRDRIENEIKFYLSQSAQSLFEAGKRFNWMKTREDHGGFLSSLERVGVSIRTADYAMAVVHKFGPNSQAPANLGSEKLRMLTVLDDEDVAGYASGGSLGDIPHDDVERMTTRELRDALRAERDKRKKQKKAQEDAISQKENRINALEEEVRYMLPPTKEQLAQVQLDELRKKFLMPINLLAEYYREAIGILDTAQQIEGVTIPQLEGFVDHFGEEIQILEGLRTDYDETIENVRPQPVTGTEE
ncbi:MAG: DUF3102 domain-containing protein [Treponema sp.]|jgi:hypothetical protein|nr:DUF3102 domain-containing protein [Treponema sp.]